MKIIHTADWHLGKVVQGVSMLEDQKYIIEQFLQHVKEIKPEAIIIAGDLYDRSIPPVEAVQLLDQTFSIIIKELNIPIIAIAGNHDSTSRVDFGSTIFKESNLHLVGKLKKEMPPIILQDKYGEIAFHLIPFADPQEVRYVFEDDSVKTNEQAMEKIIEHIPFNEGRNISIAHAFVTKNGEQIENTDESERPLSIGGSECIDANLFDKFDYTALGHLHQAHFVQSEKIRYSGSPLKYSISEATHQKGFLVVDMAANGEVEIEKIPLNPKRDMRRIEGYMKDLLEMAPSEDYVYVTLHDEAVIIAPMEKIRTVFPNAMHVDRTMNHTIVDAGESVVESKHKMDTTTLFNAFYGEILNEEPDEQMMTLFNELLAEELVEEREGGRTK